MALGSLFVPPLLPLLGIGPLTECPHCVWNYLKIYWMAPLFAPFSMLASHDRLVLVAAVGGLIIWIAALIVAVRGRTVAMRAGMLVVSALFSAASSLGLAAGLRM